MTKLSPQPGETYFLSHWVEGFSPKIINMKAKKSGGNTSTLWQGIMLIFASIRGPIRYVHTQTHKIHTNQSTGKISTYFPYAVCQYVRIHPGHFKSVILSPPRWILPADTLAFVLHQLPLPVSGSDAMAGLSEGADSRNPHQRGRDVHCPVTAVPRRKPDPGLLSQKMWSETSS